MRDGASAGENQVTGSGKQCPDVLHAPRNCHDIGARHLRSQRWWHLARPTPRPRCRGNVAPDLAIRARVSPRADTPTAHAVEGLPEGLNRRSWENPDRTRTVGPSSGRPTGQICKMFRKVGGVDGTRTLFW